MAAPVVLVVEDNAELRLVLREALGTEGYEVLAARDETEALELLRAQRVDLLVSDVMESPRSSIELEAVRQEFPELPIVAMAGGQGGHPSFFFAAWQQPKRFRALSKPFRLAELLAASRDLLGAAG
jgi:CheY-like chemotaxis protein